MITEMTHQEEEAAYFPQTELEMCVEEARAFCPIDVEPVGEGDFTLQQKAVHYCKATDAVVGSYVSSARRFPTRENAEEALRAIVEADGFDPYEDHAVILDKDGVNVLDRDADALAAIDCDEFDPLEPPF